MKRLWIQITHRYDVCINFIEAHDHCEEEMRKLLSDNDHIQEIICREIHSAREKCQHYLTTYIQGPFESITGKIQEKRVEGYLLVKLNHLVDNLEHSG